MIPESTQIEERTTMTTSNFVVGRGHSRVGGKEEHRVFKK